MSGLQEDGSNCSIFSFDVAANKSSLPLAKNALKKLRTLRHPGVIKVLDTVEVRHEYTTLTAAQLLILLKRPTHTFTSRPSGSFLSGGTLNGKVLVQRRQNGVYTA